MFQKCVDDPPSSEETFLPNNGDISTSASVDPGEVSAVPPCPSMPSRPGANKRKMKTYDLTSEVLSSVRDHFKKPKEQMDRFELLGKSIAMRLRELGKRQALIAEKKINDILYEAELSNLTTNEFQDHAIHYSSSTSHSPSPNVTPSTSPITTITPSYSSAQDNMASYFSSFNSNTFNLE